MSASSRSSCACARVVSGRKRLRAPSQVTRRSQELALSPGGTGYSGKR